MIELQVVNVPILPRIISSFLIVTLVYITILQKAGVFTICLRGDMVHGARTRWRPIYYMPQKCYNITIRGCSTAVSM